jgi:hypothetical protein
VLEVDNNAKGVPSKSYYLSSKIVEKTSDLRVDKIRKIVEKTPDLRVLQ